MNRVRLHTRLGLRIVWLAALVQVPAGPISAQHNGILDATKSHAVVPHTPALNLGATMTLEAWIRPSPQSKAFQSFIDKDYHTGFSLGVASEYPRTDSNRITLYLNYLSLAGPLVATDSVTWVHIAATIDTFAQKAIIYVNGAPAKTFTGGIRPLANSFNLMVGKSQYGDQFRGLIDEVRIWNVARTAGEIAELWQHEARGNEPGLVAVYHFEDPRDTVVWNRAVGGGLHGSLSVDAKIVSIPWPAAFTGEHEANNTPAAATPLGYNALIQEASIAAADTDCYKIWTRPGDVFRVITAPKTAGDTRKLLASVIGPDSITYITTYLPGTYGFPAFYSSASAPGYRYIRIADYGGTPGPYTITVERALTFAPDSTEPNDSRATATPMSWGRWRKATTFPGNDGGIAVPDTDYYSIVATPGEIGTFGFLQQGVSCGSAGATVLDPAGAPLVSTFPSYVKNKLFTSGGTYYTRVHSNEAARQYVVAWFKGLADVNGMYYDPMTFSSNVCLMDGWNGAYDQAYDLKINGAKFDAMADYSQAEPGGRQYVFGPAAMSGLTVWRKFYVPSAGQGDTLGYCRIQDVLTNPTGSPIMVNVGVLSDLGSDLGTRVLASSSGDTLVSASDRWVVTDDEFSPGTDPSLTSIIDGVGGADRIDSLGLSGDDLYWEWRNVVIPPGVTQIYVYFVAQDTVPARALAKGPLFAGTALPAGAKLGLGADAAKVMNWPVSALVSAEERTPVPQVFVLEQNFPNPFNPATVLMCQLAEASRMKLAVFDILGREVAVVAEGRFDAGRYRFTFDASRLASGIYLYRLEATGERSSFVDVRKMILMR